MIEMSHCYALPSDVFPVPGFAANGPLEAEARGVLLQPLVHRVVLDIDVDGLAALMVRVTGARGEVAPPMPEPRIQFLLRLLAAEPAPDRDLDPDLARRALHVAE